MIGKTFNIYCDESCHLENDHKPFMFLGSVSSAYNQVKLHTERIKELKEKHNFYAEIKWTSVSESKLRFYSELLDYFFATDLNFRSVGIEKSMIKNHSFGLHYDDFYYEMYYRLLNHQINSCYAYNVYLDMKDSLSAYKVRKLEEILNIKYGVFRNIQNIRSHESLLMQLADFIMGGISYYKNDQNKKNIAKMHLVDKLMKTSGCNFDNNNYSQKLNLFFIELK